jgi:hypothetical protein
MLVKLGMAVKTAEGLQATVNLAQGKLKLNGKDSETAGLQAGLRKEQALFEAFLSGSSQKSLGNSEAMPEIEYEEQSQESTSPPAAVPPEKPAE